ncbi:hypothetical protein NGI46_07340, partial [Peribacillus butanolivorans]|uniref:hypothetical protein n=1 Tax=Peribacillus butanolivorans TaxID=421767 RepID=UPI00207C9FD0
MGDYLRELFEKEEYERNKDKYDLFEKNFENILNDFIPQDREDQFKLRIFSGIDNYWFSENINFRTEQLFKLYFVYMLATTKKRVGLNINHVRTFIADLPGADKILRLSNEELGNSILALSNVSYIKYDGSIVLRNGNSLEMLSELKAKHNIKINNFYKKGISLVAKSIIKANQKKLFIQSGISINNA